MWARTAVPRSRAGLIRPEDRADLAQAITKAAEQKSAGGRGSERRRGSCARLGAPGPAVASIGSRRLWHGRALREAHAPPHGPPRRRDPGRTADRPEVALAALTTHWTLKLAGRPAPWRLPTAQPAGDQRDRQPARTAGRGRGHRGEPGGPAHRSRPHRLDRAPAQANPTRCPTGCCGSRRSTVQRLLTFLVASTVNGITAPTPADRSMTVWPAPSAWT